MPDEYPQRAVPEAGADVELGAPIDYLRLFEEAPAGVAVISCGGRWLRLNPALCEMLGYAEAELVGRAVSDLTHPDDLAAAVGLLRALVDGELPRFTFDQRFLRRDGEIIWLQVSAALLLDDERAPLHVVIQTEDTTETHRIENDLVRERLLLAESQLAGRIGSWEIDLETGEQRWSQEQFELYGVDPADGVPSLEGLLRLIHPEDRDRILTSLREHMASGESFSDEYRVLHATLGTRTVVQRGRYLARSGEAGRPARLAGTTHDVTAEREAEAARWALSERQRLLLASIPDALVVLVDTELRSVMIQGQILAKRGIDPGRYLGLTIAEILGEERSAVIIPLVHRALDGESGSIELPPVGERTYLLEVAPYRLDDGSIAGAFGVARDITDRLAADRQLGLFATIVEQSSDAIVVRSPDGIITEWNGGAERMYGYTAQEAIGRPTGFMVPSDRVEESDELVQDAIRAGASRTIHTGRVRKDGSVIDVSLTISPILAPDGSLLGVVGAARDVTAETRAQELLVKSERQLFEAQALAHVGSWERDLSQPRAVLSAEFCRILGQALDFSPTTREYAALIHTDDRDRVLDALRATRLGGSGESEYRIVRPGGEIRYVHARRNPRIDAAGRVTHVFGAVQDVTERKRYEERLHLLATHDSLTGLPNRRTFDERIGAELARARRHERSLCLAILDIDRFKRINDTLGHPVGDIVLAGVADVLRAQIRGDEVIARVGGEEFAWILPDADINGGLAAVQRCLDAVAAAQFERAPSITMSGGICLADVSFDVVELYRRADNALLAAKHAGGNRTVIADAGRNGDGNDTA